jgi:hypothetical protein
VKRTHPFALRLAVVGLLIDALLPAAVAAAAPRDLGSPFALCGTASGERQPAHPGPVLPIRHCALCGVIAGPLPSRPVRLITPVDVAVALLPLHAVATDVGVAPYPAAQPRAPPQAI